MRKFQDTSETRKRLFISTLSMYMTVPLNLSSALWVLLVFSNMPSSLQKQPPEVFLGKGVLKISSKFTGEHPCQSVISIKLLCNFVKITLRHGFSFRTPFYKNTYGGLLLSLRLLLCI